eukprot:NODE_3607_length_905_cov_9.848131_g3002_i0.p1 GENE.NODE_3607_length_905_cov_9.848131_g3002_i0~~NODE_3607_length_905_cov_9.848131_g3002_i0.p1  ORF type:complete len:184 (+),score=28.22 NODE_3607_length_905_cov_9.848131_g3002_i0:296-847(+)
MSRFNAKKTRARTMMEELGPHFLSEGSTVLDLWEDFHLRLKRTGRKKWTTKRLPEDQFRSLCTELGFNDVQTHLLTETWLKEKRNKYLSRQEYLGSYNRDYRTNLCPENDDVPPPCTSPAADAPSSPCVPPPVSSSSHLHPPPDGVPLCDRSPPPGCDDEPVMHDFSPSRPAEDHCPAGADEW